MAMHFRQDSAQLLQAAMSREHISKHSGFPPLQTPRTISRAATVFSQAAIHSCATRTASFSYRSAMPCRQWSIALLHAFKHSSACARISPIFCAHSWLSMPLHLAITSWAISIIRSHAYRHLLLVFEHVQFISDSFITNPVFCNHCATFTDFTSIYAV